MTIKNFLFSTVPNILYELGASVKVGSLAKELGCRSVLVVTDAGVSGLGLTQPLLEGAQRAGLRVTVYDEVTEDPPESVVLDLIKVAKRNGVDGVVGIGGGSSMDAAKVAAFMCGDTQQSLADVYGVGLTRGRRLPLIQVPTTSGTGSEVTNISVITTGQAEKKGVVGPQLYADFAVLDGDLTLSLPPSVTAATGIDAMVHAIEAYTSRHQKNVLSDTLAREALKLLSDNIRLVCEDGGDREARARMLLGSLYAGIAFANSPCAGVHALAYPLGSHFKVPHGLANSLMLPHVLRFTGEVSEASELYRQLTPVMFPRLVSTRGPGVSVLADGCAQLARDLRIPTQLSQLGIQASDTPMLAREAMKVTRLLQNNMRDIGLDDALTLYNKAL